MSGGGDEDDVERALECTVVRGQHDRGAPNAKSGSVIAVCLVITRARGALLVACDAFRGGAFDTARGVRHHGNVEGRANSLRALA